MKLKSNRRVIGERWTKKSFAWFPTQLGEFGEQGQLIEKDERIWFETYYVDYQLK